jgi:hypothetical protein
VTVQRFVRTRAERLGALYGTLARVARKLTRVYGIYHLLNLPRALWPRTYNDKIIRRKFFDRRAILPLFSDKLAVRGYVEERVGSDVLTRLYAAVRDPREIDWQALPREFVYKASHGSGAVVIVYEGAPLDAPLPDLERVRWTRWALHPDRVDHAHFETLGARWLELRYGGRPHFEWGYQRLTPHLLVEERLAAPDGSLPTELKFYVFHGRCQLIQVHRFGDRVTDYYTRDWVRRNVKRKLPGSPFDGERPTRLPELLAIAETLGAGMDFVRVDLYDLADRIVFGELTLYPGSGEKPFSPRSFDIELARHW